MTGPLAHPIEAAIGGLVAVWAGAPELRYDVDGEQTGLRVTDNPLLDDVEDRRLLLVGTSAQYLPGGAVANTGYDLAGRNVTLDIVCELHVWSGDTDAAHERAQALGVVMVCEELLAAAQQQPGGIPGVDWARVTRTTYEPAQTEQGAGATVEFTVRVDATRPHPQ